MEFKAFIYQRYDGYGYSFYDIVDWLETCRGISFEVVKMPFISGDLTPEEYRIKSEKSISCSDCVIIPILNISDVDDYCLFDINTARQYDKPIVIVSDCEINEDIKSKVNAVVEWRKGNVIQTLIELVASKSL